MLEEWEWKKKQKKKKKKQKKKQKKKKKITLHYQTVSYIQTCKSTSTKYKETTTKKQIKRDKQKETDNCQTMSKK